MLRHTALFLCRDTAGEAEKLAMLRGLAFLRMECAGVRAGDYGDDLFGGSAPLLAVPPWKRTPRWRARRSGPPCNYDVALHLDFDDEAAAAAYLADARGRAVARLVASVAVPELTARVVWRYEGAPLMRRGLVRHTALFVWAAEADAAARSRALAAARSVAGASGVVSAVIGANSRGAAADFDWILDVQVRDAAAARALVEGRQYVEATGVIAQATRHEWTARVTHVVRGYQE
jgi:hypothetical protein